MSIQRYDSFPPDINQRLGFMGKSRDGHWVRYADHVAAVSEASRGIGLADYQLIAQRGAEAERARIKAAADEWKRTVMYAEDGNGYVKFARHSIESLLAIIDGGKLDAQT